jgi:hypothetical protein
MIKGSNSIGKSLNAAIPFLQCYRGYIINRPVGFLQPCDKISVLGSNPIAFPKILIPTTKELKIISLQ